jgi:hypothetical protein
MHSAFCVPSSQQGRGRRHRPALIDRFSPLSDKPSEFFWARRLVRAYRPSFDKRALFEHRLPLIKANFPIESFSPPARMAYWSARTPPA